MWHLLLPAPADCEDTSGRDLITNDVIFRTDYEGRRRNIISVYKVPPQVFGENLSAYMI